MRRSLVLLLIALMQVQQIPCICLGHAGEAGMLAPCQTAACSPHADHDHPQTDSEPHPSHHHEEEEHQTLPFGLTDTDREHSHPSPLCEHERSARNLDRGRIGNFDLLQLVQVSLLSPAPETLCSSNLTGAFSLCESPPIPDSGRSRLARLSLWLI